MALTKIRLAAWRTRYYWIIAFVPELNPFESRIEFAGWTGGLNMSVDLDNINVLFMTGKLAH